MKTLIPAFLLGLLLLPVPLAAETLRTPGDSYLHWTLPVGWEVRSVPPAPLVEELTTQLREEARHQGRNPTEETLKQAALRRLKMNELLLFHPASGAWLSCDFSPLKSNEGSPDADLLALSARYALESLTSEEGVTVISSRQTALNLPGAPGTRRLQAEYVKHGIRTRFDGLVGYRRGEWFFIYLTSYPDKADLAESIGQFFTGLAFDSSPH